jgi:hypothetical protein
MDVRLGTHNGLWQAVQGRVYERVLARFDTLGFQQ